MRDRPSSMNDCTQKAIAVDGVGKRQYQAEWWVIDQNFLALCVLRLPIVMEHLLRMRSYSHVIIICVNGYERC